MRQSAAKPSATKSAVAKSAATKPKKRKAATLEDVWAVIREIGEQHKEIREMQKVTEKKFQELAKERAESQKVAEKEFQKLAKERAESQKELKELHKETEKEFQKLAKERAERQKVAEKEFQELREMQKKLDASVKETTATVKETTLSVEKTTASVKELSENVGGLNNTLGDLAEGLMASDLYEKFEAIGLDFDSSIPNYELKEKKTKRMLAEVDMLLLNGTIAMAVEVKTHMTQGDVNKHLKRMVTLRRELPNSLFANRTLYGAMASVKASKAAREYAITHGFFVIELTGDIVKIDTPTGFKPKTW
jgi:DNA repair exonuclease SbcCD ATPase subunit